MAKKQRQSITAYAFDKKGRLLSVGHNSYTKTHPLQLWYAKRCGLDNKMFLHAEMAALIKTRGRKVHKLVIVRVGRDKSLLNAKPCPVCQLAIKEFGVKVVEHS